MKVLVLLAALLLLASCAHWQQMSQHEKNIVIGSAVAGLVIGALVNDGDSHDHHCHGHHCGDSDSD